MKPGEVNAPHHDAAAMASAEEELLSVETKGSIEAALNGTVTKFEFLPTGSNVAIFKPDTGVARVAIGGAPTATGMPLLKLSLDGVQLDKLVLPATLEVVAGTPPAGASARVEYMLTEQKLWQAQPGGRVTIESYTGKRVQGTFAAKLDPRSTAFGPPIEVTNGRFDVELRLNGAAPGS